MTKKRFSQETMRRLADSYAGDKLTIYGEYNSLKDDFEDDMVLEVLHNEEYDTTRWNSVRDLVFIDCDSGEGYHTRYEKGLTESQMLNPFQYDKDGVDCDIVDVWEEQVTTTVIKWGKF